MKLQVLDASIGLKWFFPREPLHAAALEVLDLVRERPQNFVVPELFFNETLAVLTKAKGQPAATRQRYVTLLSHLGLGRVGNGDELLQRAFAMATAWNLSGYDAIYAATAELVGGTWLTADQAAAKRIPTKGLVRLLQ